MEIMARSFHLREFHVYVLTNGIFASAGTAEISEVRNVPQPHHPSEPGGGSERPLPRDRRGQYDSGRGREPPLCWHSASPSPRTGCSWSPACAARSAFALIFGGTLRSALAAALAGFLASGYLLLCGRHDLPGGFCKISCAALITLACILGCSLLGTSASHAIIGSLMILTPGIAFTMGIRDFVQGDYLSGTIRMIDALLIAASIAIGTGLVLSLYTFFTGVVVA